MKKVTVNGIQLEVGVLDDLISYEDVVALALKTGNPTVTYRGPRKGDSRRSGEMHFGCDPVLLEDGMVFSVMHTGNA